MRIKHPLKFIPLVNIPTKPPSAIILGARQFYTFPQQTLVMSLKELQLPTRIHFSI